MGILDDSPDPGYEDTGGPAGAEAAEPESREDGSFDGGRSAGAPAPREPAAEVVDERQPPPPEAHALQPLLNHLPPGLRRQIAGGQMTPEEAVVRHYGGRRWNDLIRRDGQASELEGKLAKHNERFAAIVNHLTNVLGVELPKELQPPEAPQPPSEVAQLADKVDQFMSTVEDQRLDGVVDQVDRYDTEDMQAAVQEEPEYEAAKEFFVNRLIEATTGRYADDLYWFNVTKDVTYLRSFPREYLQAVVDGEMTEDEMITRAALDRCFTIAATAKTRHFQNRTSLSQEILAAARKAGWRSTREGGDPPPARTAKPNGREEPPPPPRRDPNLTRVREGMSRTPPASRRSQPAVDPVDALERVANMPNDEFAKMLDESPDPRGLLDRLLRLTSVQG